MTEREDRLAAYIEHLEARIRSQRGNSTRQVLPDEIGRFCTEEPRACLDLIISALEQSAAPERIQAIGDELLENLLNENSASINPEVSEELRTNKRFRQAFAFGNYASVDPAIISDWVQIFQELGTTKAAERKSLYDR